MFLTQQPRVGSGGQHYLANRIHPSKYFVGGTVVGLKLHDPEVMGLSPAGCLAFYPRFLSLIYIVLP